MIADDAPVGEPLWPVEYDLVIFAIYVRLAKVRPKSRRLPSKSHPAPIDWRRQILDGP